MTVQGVYLVGSVPMRDAEQVFREVGTTLGQRLRWLPDGETGPRINWIAHLEPVFATQQALVKSDEVFQLHPTAPKRQRYTLAPGKKIEDIAFPNLGYADAAIASYSVFKRLKAQGLIADGVKFQVDFAPAHSVLWLFLVDALHRAADPIYNDAIKREIDRIAATVPHNELAIQFDVASAVFARLQREESSPYGNDKAEMQETFNQILVGLGNHVPRDVDLLYHCCYGDSNHRHVVEPTDMGDMVEFANRLFTRIGRPVQLIHMPVPRNRKDDVYFEPLKRLRLPKQTTLALGLVHCTDGMQGTRERLNIAMKYADNFFIATECGLGRRDPDTIPALLDIHGQLVDVR